MISVLFISHSLLMSGGANRSMVQLIVELRARHGIKPVVLAPWGKTPKDDPGLVEFCKKNGIAVERSFVPWFIHCNVWLQRAKFLLLFCYYPILMLKIKKYQIQLVHSNGSVFDLGARLSKSLNVPHIWHLREFGFENSEFKNVVNSEHRKKMFATCNNFIAISHAIKNSYKSIIPENRIRCIYNGISANVYNIIALHNNELVQFVIVGVLTPHKNQLEAIYALNELVKNGITKIHLNIIGRGDNQYERDMKAFVTNNNLQKYVTFWGIRNDVPDLLSRMDVGLMLSKNEAFGRVTVEYMFQNLAVIASDTGANPELIKDGETGFLYKLGDYQQLAKIMGDLSNSASLLDRVASAGRSFAKESFDSLRNSDAVYELYGNALDLTVL